MSLAEHSMPEIVGLCPVHLHEFYAPHGGVCPQCQRTMVEYVPRAASDREAVEALREIATRPTMERNPDGDDQAAHTMQLIAREALDALGEQ